MIDDFIMLCSGFGYGGLCGRTDIANHDSCRGDAIIIAHIMGPIRLNGLVQIG